MRANRRTRYVGRRVILVPYEKRHVPKYHDWMRSAELQRLTASEPLSLEAEYEMQKKWSEDEDKCTFIILSKDVLQTTGEEIDAMIGDTNLFFNDSECATVAEAEIMIADANDRGKKMGWEAMILMLRYGIDVLNVKKYEVKISEDNEKSLQMFLKLKFHEVSRSEVFREVTLQKAVDDEWIEWLTSETADASRDENYS